MTQQTADLAETLVDFGAAAATGTVMMLAFLAVTGLVLRLFDRAYHWFLGFVPTEWRLGFEGMSRSFEVASLLASLLIAFCFYHLAHVVGASTGSRAAATALAAAGVAVGGFFAAAGVSRVDPRRAWVYGTLLLVLAAVRSLLGAFAAGAPASPSVSGGLLHLAELTLGQIGMLPDRSTGGTGPVDAGWGVVLLVLPLAMAGGALEIALERWSRSRNPRKRWEYVTRDGRAVEALGPWRDPVLARVWFALAAALLLTCWVPLLTAAHGGNVVGWAFLGLACAAQGRRRIAVGADEALKADPRPPVVYLRSFNDDGRKPGGGVLQQLLSAAHALVTYTLEQRLSRACRKLGPFVAIGRPGEALPEFGAARMYVSDDDWRAVVDDLVRGARGVVLQAGDTRGLEWELGKTGEVVPPPNVLVFIPFRGYAPIPMVSAVAARWREARYGEFKALARGHLPADLPERIGPAYFLYFDPTTGWSARALKAFARVNPAHPLGQLLRRLSRDTVFFWAGSFMTTLVVVMPVLMLVALLVPAVQAAREATRQARSVSNLKEIGLAVRNYADVNGLFPLGTDVGRDGVMHHGFQARLLPFMEQTALANAINFNLPWDEPANSTAARAEVGAFLHPRMVDRVDGRGYGLSHYAGSARFFRKNRAPSWADFPDGLSHTVMLGEVAGGFQPWAYPANWRDPALPLNTGVGAFGSLSRRPGGVTHFLKADGSVVSARRSLDELSLEPGLKPVDSP